jgi:hypothetical protein
MPPRGMASDRRRHIDCVGLHLAVESVMTTTGAVSEDVRRFHDECLDFLAYTVAPVRVSAGGAELGHMRRWLPGPRVDLPKLRAGGVDAVFLSAGLETIHVERWDLTAALLGHGYSRATVRKLLGTNLLRLFRDVAGEAGPRPAGPGVGPVSPRPPRPTAASAGRAAPGTGRPPRRRAARAPAHPSRGGPGACRSGSGSRASGSSPARRRGRSAPCPSDP